MLHSLQALDYSVFHFINQTIANPFLDVLLPFMRNASSWIPLYFLLGFYCIHKYKEKAIVYILYIVIAFALADFISASIIKPLIGRLRPCHSLTLHARLVLGYCGGRFGFPSTHACNHIAIAWSIVLANIFTKKWMNYLWILWALTIGFAQIYVGVHYPIDVIAGFVLGCLIAYFNFYIILPFLNKMFVFLYSKKNM